MMDIKLVTHAKEYIDDMAKGIHPLTKEELPEDSDIYAVRNGYVSVGPLYSVSAR